MSKSFGVGCLGGIALSASYALAVTYEVGPGKPFATIQGAVDAIAATEGQPGHVPNPTILIHTGVYNELVEIPFDPDFSTAGAGVNDGWTIKAAPGANVKLQGHMIFMFGRENFLIEGLVIDNTNSSNVNQFAGINFHGGTTRGNTVRNCVVYGVNNDGVFGKPAVRGNFTYGANTLDRVTIFDVDYAITANTSAHFAVINSIVTSANNYGIFSTPGSPSSVAFSNFFNNAPNYSGTIIDNGNNVNHPSGVDPMFVSTDPTNEYFLWLRPDSPLVAAGEGGVPLGGRPVFEPVWNGNSNSNWSNDGNWVAGFVPNAIGTTARLPASAATRTLAVDVPITVGKLTIEGATAYTIAGPQTLTIQKTTGVADVIVETGAHTIGAPVNIATDARLTGGGALKLASLAVAAGATLDTTDRPLIVDYTGSSPRAELEALVASGFAGGANNGDGIASSSAAANRRLGIAEASETSLGGSFAGHTLDSTSVVLRLTVPGDANLSGGVNLDDFTALAAAFGGAGRWAGGDFDYNGLVNLDDFTILAANFGQSLQADASRAVPEPLTAAPVLLAAAALLRRRGRTDVAR